MKTIRFARRLLGAAALVAAGHAVAVPVTLVLNDVSDKNTSNPQDIQCIIFGNSCPGGKQDMSALNYQQGGNQTLYDLYSSPNDKGKNESAVVANYTVGYLASFLSGSKVFGIGIDVNTANPPPERLLTFSVQVDETPNDDSTGWVDQFVFLSSGDGARGGALDPAFNGNGFFDFTLNTVDLSAFNNIDLVRFYARWDRASDGPENFFVYRGALPPIPEPSTYALMLAGLGAVGYMARRRRNG